MVVMGAVAQFFLPTCSIAGPWKKERGEQANTYM